MLISPCVVERVGGFGASALRTQQPQRKVNDLLACGNPHAVMLGVE